MIPQTYRYQIVDRGSDTLLGRDLQSDSDPNCGRCSFPFSRIAVATGMGSNCNERVDSYSDLQCAASQARTFQLDSQSALTLNGRAVSLIAATDYDEGRPINSHL